LLCTPAGYSEGSWILFLLLHYQQHLVSWVPVMRNERQKQGLSFRANIQLGEIIILLMKDVSSKTIQPVTFTVKETVCLVSEKRDPNQCEFKEDGVRITPCTETPPSALLSLIPQIVPLLLYPITDPYINVTDNIHPFIQPLIIGLDGF
uniref:Uncharacterized protein n=1 Tax=Terrapene triunguis TaxID=2587831 RepID=A0A674JLK4_9SAUR